MVGAVGLALIVAYLALSCFAVILIPRLVKTRQKKIIVASIVIAVAAAFPIGDPVYSYMCYAMYCNVNAGGKVYRVAKDVSVISLDQSAASFYIPQGKGISTQLSANLRQYKYVEIIRGNQLFQFDNSREELFGNEKEIERSMSSYVISQKTIVHNRRYTAIEFKIQDYYGNTLATFQFVGWHGGGFNGPLFNFVTSGYGPAKEIRPPRGDIVRFIYEVLVPTTQ